MKLYLDDLRMPTEELDFIARSYEEAITIIQNVIGGVKIDSKKASFMFNFDKIKVIHITKKNFHDNKTT